MEMPSFYLIAVIIAVVLLILCLTGVGILMKYQNAGQVFPPAAQVCPDGWTIDVSTCGVKIGTTPNNGRLGSIKYSDLSANSPYQLNSYSLPANYLISSTIGDADISVNFTLPAKIWTTCQQKNWANKYGIEWDGISNYNGSC